MGKPLVSIGGSTEAFWSLQRKGPQDQDRHQEKVREAIRNNLTDLIADESIIASNGKTVVKVPVHSLKEFHFRFDPFKGRHVGQGKGGTRVGDAVAAGTSSGGEQGGAGQEPGRDYYEAEVSVEELDSLLFAELNLPDLRQKGASHRRQVNRCCEVRRKGVMPNLDRRRTVMASICRAARDGRPGFIGILGQDLRFRSYKERPREEANAAIIAIRDVSGSMGEFKKLMSRTFFFWMQRFLRSRYHFVQIVYITHHLEAKEVAEEAFFCLGESGGTRVSSAYQLALDIIRQRFDPAYWNTYVIHFTDGDNWGDADNRRCLQLVREILGLCNLFGYGEINEGGYVSPLMSVLSAIDSPRFIPVSISGKSDVVPALRRMFTRNPGGAGHGRQGIG